MFGGGGEGEVENEIGNDEAASAEVEGFAGCGGGGLIGKVKNDAVFWINRRRCLDERVRERKDRKSVV